MQEDASGGGSNGREGHGTRPGADGSARGAVFALVAAALFGASAPASKRLLGEAHLAPLVLAGLLYLGSGVGLTVARAASRLLHRLRDEPSPTEAPLRRADLPRLLGVLLLGGLAGPALLLVGLARTSGLVGALLLNLETPFTLLLAVSLFREHVGRRGALGALLVVAGAASLGLVAATGEAGSGGDATQPLGALAVAGACLCWAVDNNLAAQLSLKDPVALTRVKSLFAALANLALGLLVALRAAHQAGPTTPLALPAPTVIALALALGALSYGASIVLALYAARLLGAARQSAYFATAPFVGALVAVPLLGERPSPVHALAAATMAVGVWLLARAPHAHTHRHEPLEHDHLHTHDEHHQHDHPPGTPTGEPHAHPHRHAPLVHAHPHVSDAHHRHTHDEE